MDETLGICNQPRHKPTKGPVLGAGLFLFALLLALAAVWTISGIRNHERLTLSGMALATILICLPTSLLWMIEIICQHQRSDSRPYLPLKRRFMIPDTGHHLPTANSPGHSQGHKRRARWQNFLQHLLAMLISPVPSVAHAWIYGLLSLAAISAAVVLVAKTRALWLGLLVLMVVLFFQVGHWKALQLTSLLPDLLLPRRSARGGTALPGTSLLRHRQPLRRRASPTRRDDNSSAATRQPSAETDILQRLVREKLTDGRERVHAELKVEFPPDAWEATSHVAFCPPFAMRPEVIVRQTAGPEARLRILKILPQGVAIAIKLRQQPADRACVDISVHAEGPPLKITWKPEATTADGAPTIGG